MSQLGPLTASLIWNRSPRTLLRLFLGSTERKLYVSEIMRKTGLSPNTVIAALDRLATADILIREPERPSFESSCRAPRVYYSLNPEVVDYLRL